LTVRFQHEIEKRLLHVGATTKHILDVYMLLIQTFTTLDSRGVLLDNVSRPIRKYLKGRSDTAKIIISSMLAEPRGQAGPDISKAITAEMIRPINIAAELQRHDYDLDYDNMDYMPQPNDASPGFKRNESNDAVAHLFSLYDKEQFISSLKNILGEHLLRTADETDLDKEIQLLEMFKVRFGDEKLQACEVMLQDIANSRRLNRKIHDMPEFRQGMLDDGQDMDLTTQVISAYFWPELRDDEFAVPGPVQHLQKLYEQGFESQHNLMKLKWLSSLGRATVELELSDRVVTENVPTWVASVVYAFHSEDGAPPPTKTIDQLADGLSMEDGLVRNGIAFWVGKRVLEEMEGGSYRVIESLSSESEARPAGRVMMMEEEVSAVKSTQDLLEENVVMYRGFVKGMLMNQGSMPLNRILNMLKIALPGGFPFSESDLKGILEAMVNEGLLLCSGDVYSVKKG
jgi:anaphase-promoting complex subunit 2